MRTWEEESCWSPKEESQTQTETEKRLLGQFFDYEQDREQALIKGLQKNVVLNETENLHKESDNLDGKNKKYEYPLRPYAEDCPFYLRTGCCKFGLYCKFNHPLRTFQGVKEKEQGEFLEQPGQIQIQCKFFLSAGGCKNGEACRFSHSIEKSKIPPAELDAFCLPTELEKENKSEGIVEKTGQIECKYYLSAGGCKYGKTCKFSHSKEKSFTYIKKSEIAPPELNFLGLPIRVLEKECPFYMRNGSCAYGVNCKFHHPDPVASKESDPSDPIPTGVSLEGNSSGNYYGITNKLQLIKESEPALEISSNMIPHNFVPSYNNTIASHAHWTHPNSKWSGHQGSLYPFPRTHSVPAKKNPNDTGNISRYNNEVEEFPQRPGQPECSYFMKTGDCRYASACKFHHPKSRA